MSRDLSENRKQSWDDQEKNIPGRKKSKCKGPEMGTRSVCLRDIKVSKAGVKRG